MSLADLTNKITADAEEQASSIIEAARKNVSVIGEKTEKEKKEFTALYEAETLNILKDNKSRLQSSAEQEVKILSERSKRNALDSIFSDAIEHITSFSDNEYAALLQKIVAKNLPQNISGKAVCPANRLAITKKILADTDFNGEVTEDTSLKSGFIIMNDTFEYDFTFEKAISDKRQELEIDIANILFKS